MPFGHRDHADLGRCEPLGKHRHGLVSGLLEEGTDHPLDRTRWRAVQDRWEHLGAVLVVLDIETSRRLDIDLHGRVLDRSALSVDGGKIDLRDPVVDAFGEELDQHRGAGIGNQPHDPIAVILVEGAGAPEGRNERGLEVASGLPPEAKLLLEAGERLVEIAAEGVHVGHGEGPKTLQPDHLAALLVPERVRRELVHLHREGVRRDVHIAHDREHAEACGEPEHHAPVAGPEPVLALAELVRVLEDRLIAQVVHHRGLDRRTTVGEDEPERVVREQISDQLAAREPAEVTHVRGGLVVDELLGAHQLDVDWVSPGRHGNPELFPDKGSEGGFVQERVDLVLDPVGGHYEERVLDRALRFSRRPVLSRDDRLGELGEGVALAPERERLVPAERGALDRVGAEVVETLFDQGENPDRGIGGREVVREMGIRVDQDIAGLDPVGRIDDLGDSLVDDVLDTVGIALLDRGEDGERLLHAVDEQRALLGDPGLLSRLVFHGVRMDQKKSHVPPRISGKILCAHPV
ncbi:hypothetical protein DSECCO2_516200 [anaerobic digester metagenome]